MIKNCTKLYAFWFILLAFFSCKETSEKSVSYSNDSLVYNYIDNIVIENIRKIHIISNEILFETKSYEVTNSSLSVEIIENKITEFNKISQLLSFLTYEFPSLNKLDRKINYFPVYSQNILNIFENPNIKIDSIFINKIPNNFKGIGAFSSLLSYYKNLSSEDKQKIDKKRYFNLLKHYAKNISDETKFTLDFWLPQGKDIGRKYKNSDNDNTNYTIIKIINSIQNRTYSFHFKHIVLPLEEINNLDNSYLLGNSINKTNEFYSNYYEALKVLINGSRLGENKIGFDDYYDFLYKKEKKNKDSINYNHYQEDKIHVKINNKIEKIKSILWHKRINKTLDITKKNSPFYEIKDYNIQIQTLINELRDLVVDNEKTKKTEIKLNDKNEIKDELIREIEENNSKTIESFDSSSINFNDPSEEIINEEISSSEVTTEKEDTDFFFNEKLDKNLENNKVFENTDTL